MNDIRMILTSLNALGQTISQPVDIWLETASVGSNQIFINVPVMIPVRNGIYNRKVIAVSMFIELHGDGEVTLNTYRRNSMTVNENIKGDDLEIVVEDGEATDCICWSEGEKTIVLWDKRRLDLVRKNTKHVRNEIVPIEMETV